MDEKKATSESSENKSADNVLTVGDFLVAKALHSVGVKVWKLGSQATPEAAVKRGREKSPHLKPDTREAQSTQPEPSYAERGYKDLQNYKEVAESLARISKKMREIRLAMDELKSYDQDEKNGGK